MGLYNFKPQFVPFILDGSKRHTIRAERRNVERVGQVMHLYTGLRQRGARLLLRAPCLRVERIEISNLATLRGSLFSVFINGGLLTGDETERLARADGFESLWEMVEFWEGRLPFSGHIIHWDFDQAVFGPGVPAAAKGRKP